MTMLASPVPSSAERRRVSAHISWAARWARRHPPRLDPLRSLVRLLLLDELERYRTRGTFPRNPGRPVPVPVFIDAHGTRCAMAHLLEFGGEAALVARVARERNYARVQELADEPRLLAWLAAAGLTLKCYRSRSLIGVRSRPAMTIVVVAEARRRG
jgi:hypothetical protein